MIALFGTAVQAGVVMVIYLQEAVAHKAATRSLSRERLHEAILEGALLRLRPKVMTVATVVAGLLPIMWSQRTGAEVMKPLATPGVGGHGQFPPAPAHRHPGDFAWLRERSWPGNPGPTGRQRTTRPSGPGRLIRAGGNRHLERSAGRCYSSGTSGRGSKHGRRRFYSHIV